MLDLNNVESVEILLGAGNQIWVNVDGACALRIHNESPPIVVVHDDRHFIEPPPTKNSETSS